MKKITLLSMLLCMAVSIFAQKSVTFDFTTDGSGLPTVEAVADDYTFNGYTFTIQNGKWNDGSKYGDPSYLFIYNNTKGKQIDGYVTLPAMDFKIGSISVKTGASASTSVQVALMKGDVVVETKTLNATNSDFTWTITGDEVGTRYTLKVVNTKNAQFQTITITEASSAGTLNFKNAGDVNFGVVLEGVQTQEIEVVTDGLSENVSVSVEGEGFTADVTSLPSTGGSVNVTFEGAAAGTAKGTITLKSGDLKATTNLVAVVAEHRGTLNDALSVEDVAILCDKTGTTEYWVSGVVAGSAANNGALAEETTYTNLALGTAEPYVPVQLPKGDIRTAINPYDNPDMVGETVWVKGQLLTYFSVAGIKNLTDYSLDGINAAISALESAKVINNRAFAVNGYIKTTGNNETVNVYNVTGKLVATGIAGRDIKISQKGIYIVKVGEKATKVVVR